jgi:hypothetical protein
MIAKIDTPEARQIYGLSWPNPKTAWSKQKTFRAKTFFDSLNPGLQPTRNKPRVADAPPLEATKDVRG